jgi:hypothetical protein
MPSWRAAEGDGAALQRDKVSMARRFGMTAMYLLVAFESSAYECNKSRASTGSPLMPTVQPCFPSCIRPEPLAGPTPAATTRHAFPASLSMNSSTSSSPSRLSTLKLHRRYTPFVFAFFMAGIMAFLMCCTIVAANTGFDAGYVRRVFSAYALAMPVAFFCVMMVGRWCSSWLR